MVAWLPMIEKWRVKDGFFGKSPSNWHLCFLFLWCSYYQGNPGGEDEFYLEYAPRMDNDTMTPTTHSLAWRTRKTAKIETYSLKLWIQSLVKLNPPRLLSHFDVGQMFTHVSSRLTIFQLNLPVEHLDLSALLYGRNWPNWWLQAGVPENVCR